MRVTLIEDDHQKAGEIQDFLSSRFSAVVLTTYGSFNSGLRGVMSEPPDLLLLDMTLPTFDRAPGVREGRLRPLGGYELMRKLALRSISVPTIVVTQLEAFGEGADKVSFDDISLRCENEFPHSFRGMVRFQLAGARWKDDLEILVFSVQ